MGTIKLMLPQLHISNVAEYVYDCENITVKSYGTHLKNNMATIADLLENQWYVLKFKILELAVSDLHKM